MLLVAQSRQRGGLRHAADVKWLPCFLQDLDQFRMRDAVAYPKASQPLDLRKRAQDDNVASVAHELERIRRLIDIFEIRFIKRDHDSLRERGDEAIDLRLC